jgi:hypothetical protein
MYLLRIGLSEIYRVEKTFENISDYTHVFNELRAGEEHGIELIWVGAKVMLKTIPIRRSNAHCSHKIL